MKVIDKNFNKKENGFNGSYKAYKLSCDNNALRKFLHDHCDDNGRIYEAIKKSSSDIIILQNLNIEKSDQNKGYGSLVLKEIISDSIQAVILTCDITQSQRFDFILDKFYELHDFKTIETYQDYPLMLYPSVLANKVINLLSSEG